MMARGGTRVTGIAALLLLGLGGFGEAGSPELTKAEQTHVMKQGELSGMAEVCGLDWKALSFTPMMAYWRRSGKSEQQMALIGILHGAGQGFVTAKPGRCTAAMRHQIKAQLPFKG